MARYGVDTRLTREQVMQKALTFFGEGGLGLEIVDQETCCARFQGGGGHVFLQIDETGSKVSVTLETREWDHPVRQFMQQIA